MTVGISISNGQEAIVITDAMGSGSGRQSNQYTKVARFEGPSYFGVVYGTGVANQIDGVHRDLVALPKDDSPYEFMRNLKGQFIARLNEAERNELAEHQRIIDNEANVIGNPDKRSQFLDERLRRLHGEYEQSAHNPLYRTTLNAVFFDKTMGRIRKFYIAKSALDEIFSDHTEIGSGSDGANLYFAMKLQGLDLKKLDIYQLLFYGMNSFTYSTVNQGVGGAPNIVCVDGSEIRKLNSQIATALANVSAHYVAEKVNAQQAQRMTKDLFNGFFGHAGRTMKMDLESLSSVYVPYSEIQASVNRKSQQ